MEVTGNGRDAQEQIVHFIGERCRAWRDKDKYPLPPGLLATE